MAIKLSDGIDFPPVYSQHIGQSKSCGCSSHQRMGKCNPAYGSKERGTNNLIALMTTTGFKLSSPWKIRNSSLRKDGGNRFQFLMNYKGVQTSLNSLAFILCWLV